MCTLGGGGVRLWPQGGFLISLPSGGGIPLDPLRMLTLFRAPLHAGARRVRQDTRRGASRATSDGAAPPDSLRTGKITGNFRHFRPFQCVPSAFSVGLRCNPSALRMIPCSSLEQGIRFGRTGNCIRRNSGSPIPLGGFGSRIPLALFSAKTRWPALISLGRGTVRKAVEFLCIRKIIYFIPQ